MDMACFSPFLMDQVLLNDLCIYRYIRYGIYPDKCIMSNILQKDPNLCFY